MKHSRLALMLLVIVLALGMVSAYAETEAEPEFDGEIRIGLICPVTGTSKAIGDYQQNGFNLAMEEINAAGGILGKKVVGVIADEVDNMQSAVNAHMLLLSDDSIMGIVGSTYSVYTIAAIPQITEAGVPYIAGGSSSGITDEGSDYVWMVRPTDVYQGQVLADVAIEVLGMQNPAIMYSTQSSLMALQERLVAALQERGIEVDPGNLYGFPEEEQNYPVVLCAGGHHADRGAAGGKDTTHTVGPLPGGDPRQPNGRADPWRRRVPHKGHRLYDRGCAWRSVGRAVLPARTLRFLGYVYL